MCNTAWLWELRAFERMTTTPVICGFSDSFREDIIPSGASVSTKSFGSRVQRGRSQLSTNLHGWRASLSRQRPSSGHVHDRRLTCRGNVGPDVDDNPLDVTLYGVKGCYTVTE